MPVGAMIALGVVVGVLVVAVLVSTPWQSLDLGGRPATPVDPGRDFSAAEQAATSAYQQAVQPALLAGVLAGLVVALLLGLTPLGARVVTACGAPFGGGWLARALAGGLGLLVLGRLAVLPTDVWVAAVRRDAGLLVQPWPAWLGEQARLFAVTAAVSLTALTVLVALARYASRTWWAWAAALAAGLVVAGSFLYPVVVEPLVTRTQPMPPGPQRTALLDLAQRAGVPLSDVLVADASSRTTAQNAWVSGFGASRRLVVHDTLLDAADPTEVTAVVAHELGHVARHDVLVGTLLGALAAAAGTLLVAIAASWGPLLARAGADGPGDPRVLGLVLAVVAVLTVAASPAQNAVSRAVERRADVDALSLTGDAAAHARLQKRLAVANRSSLDPPAWRYVWFFSHPTPPERLALARDWARVAGRPAPPDLAGWPTPPSAG